MISTSATRSSGNIYNPTATQSRRNTTDVAPSSGIDAGAKVSISAAAREAAKNDPATRSGIKLPDHLVKLFNKDFPQDVLDEAKARLDDIKANGAIGASGLTNLPLLPENQKLLDSFRQEMKTIDDAGFANATPEQSFRFNLLLNLSMRLQLTGWEKPMTEADVQRQLDVSMAMAKLSIDDPAPPPVADPDEFANDVIAGMRSGSVPTVWRQRWEEAGLSMPKDVALSPNRSMWLDVAKAAGIGEGEFISKLRDLAGNLKGNALTHAIESFISERYVAASKA